MTFRQMPAFVSLCCAAMLSLCMPATAAAGDTMTSQASAHAETQLPAIVDGQLMVDGKPYLALGGEVHNSSSSDPAYMARVWDHLDQMNVRTVVSPIDWALTEPQEGVFDFSRLDAQIAEARARDMRIVLIWFGAYKNAASTYAPGWVRADRGRFMRARIEANLPQAFTYEGAMPKPVLSVFSPALLEADTAAFTAMLRHLAEVDPDHRVVMVQVNNESGMLGDSRDRSELAEAAWASPVPQALLRYMAANRASLKPELREVWARQGSRTSGTWEQVFGTDWQADEIFMAWHFASYMEEMAKAGKAVMPLPMYANAWLGPQDGQPTAGKYPSGGPTRRVLDVWMAAAPSLDLLAPDIYVPGAKAVLASYDHRGNPIFVPEGQFATGDMMWAIGNHDAIGFSVFGIEEGRTGSQLASALAILNPMTEIITRAQAEDRIAAVLMEDDQPAILNLGGYEITLRQTDRLFTRMLLDAGVTAPQFDTARPSETEGPGARPAPADARPFGLIIDEGNDSFLMIGQNFTADFARNGKLAEGDHVEEGRFEAGTWQPGRVLNGDERLMLLPIDRIGMVRIRLLPPLN